MQAANKGMISNNRKAMQEQEGDTTAAARPKNKRKAECAELLDLLRAEGLG